LGGWCWKAENFTTFRIPHATLLGRAGGGIKEIKINQQASRDFMFAGLK
jgi:hypothetical protein